MKQKFINIVFSLVLILCASSSISNAFPEPKECLVIGNQANPVLGMKFFKEAMNMKMKGKTTEAINLYEKAILADNAILKYDDYGLSTALLQKYRNAKGPQTTAFLCKKAFLENIVAGDLPKSIDLYNKATEIASTTQLANIAKNEEKRLTEELDYINNWQNSVKRSNAYKRKLQMTRYIEEDKIDEIQTTISDNNSNLEELQERLTYLQKKEKEVSKEMYRALSISKRARSRYYSPEYYNNAAYSEYNPPPSESFNRSYTFQNIAKKHQTELSHVRAEISGIKRRISDNKKKNVTLREKINEM